MVWNLPLPPSLHGSNCVDPLLEQLLLAPRPRTSCTTCVQTLPTYFFWLPDAHFFWEGVEANY